MATEQSPAAGPGYPVGTIILLLMASLLYAAMLENVRTTDSGDAAFGAAFAWFFCTAGLWIVLTALLLAGVAVGEMPRKAALAWLAVQPLAGAALLASGDYYSRHRHAPPIVPVLLPLLIAGYAVWARFPALHVRFPPRATSATALGCVAGISVLSLLIAANN